MANNDNFVAQQPTEDQETYFTIVFSNFMKPLLFMPFCLFYFDLFYC